MMASKREYLREYMRKYRVTHLEQVRAINRKAVKKYNAVHPERARASCSKAYKKFRITHPERLRELVRKASKKYRATHKKAGRERKKRYTRKGFAPLAPNVWNCPVDWHHVSPNHPYVVPLPRSVHQAMYGKYHFVFNAAMIGCLFELDLRESVSVETEKTRAEVLHPPVTLPARSSPSL